MSRKIMHVGREDIMRAYHEDVAADLFRAADKLGCSVGTLRKLMLKYGIDSKPRMRGWRRIAKFKELTDKEWLREQLQANTYEQVAKGLEAAHDLKCTVTTVANWARKHGLQCKNSEKSEAVKRGLKNAYPDGRTGDKASNWKGGRCYGGTNNEYVLIYKPDHVNASKQGYVMEHRLVMEEYLGRLLDPKEEVYHKNGVKDDNHLENLEVVSRQDHVKAHYAAVKEVATLRNENAVLRTRLTELEGGAS